MASGRRQSVQQHEESIRQESDEPAEEFFDCRTETATDELIRRGSPCNGSFGRQNSIASTWAHRHCLPGPMVSRSDFSLWSFFKLCIGRELSKITMPIVFNEPLSFLQRMVEYMEYARTLLEKASESSDPIERMELVTAFAVSASASNWERTGKPFNPLLGETYELDSTELGFRVLCEQVEHHPPVSAFHVDSANYTIHSSIHVKIKYWGSSIQVIPKGLVTLHLHRHNEVYSWQNINCSVHNIIIGNIWIEHTGEMEVTNHTSKLRTVLQFKPCGWTGNELHKVHGYLYNSHRRKIRCFYGKWVEALYSCDVSVWDRLARSSWRDMEEPTKSDAAEIMKVPEDIPESASNSCNLNLPGQKLLWVATPKPDNTSRCYNFTRFALMLNETSPELESLVAPTDSRLRPDIRLMEYADVEGASAEKSRLEEKQREARKDRSKSKEEYKPRWFKLTKNRFTGSEEWQYTGEYWKRDWSKCPSIY